jgi:hypothetical protein
MSRPSNLTGGIIKKENKNVLPFVSVKIWAKIREICQQYDL